MVLSIIAAVVTMGIIATAAVGVAVSPDSYYKYRYYDDLNPDGYSYQKRKVSRRWSSHEVFFNVQLNKILNKYLTRWLIQVP